MRRVAPSSRRSLVIWQPKRAKVSRCKCWGGTAGMQMCVRQTGSVKACMSHLSALNATQPAISIVAGSSPRGVRLRMHKPIRPPSLWGGGGRAEETRSGARFTHNNPDSPNLKRIQMSSCCGLWGRGRRANASGRPLCICARTFLAASQLRASLRYWEAGEGCLVTKYLACSLFSRF